MYYGEIKNCDIANGEGVRVTLFVSGCTNRCKNCFQPQTWAFDYGQPFTAETEEALLQMLAPAYINGLTLLGGEPFEPENQRGLLPFLRLVRERLPGKTIWAFTGFTWEQLHTDGSHPRCEVTDELLSLVCAPLFRAAHGLIDGHFVHRRRDCCRLAHAELIVLHFDFHFLYSFSPAVFAAGAYLMYSLSNYNVSNYNVGIS